MKAKQTALISLTLVSTLVAGSAFGQGQGKGVGVGVGAGSQTKVGVGGGAGVKVPGADVGVKTKTDVNAKTSVEGKGTNAKKADGETTFATRIESNHKLQPMLPTGVTLKDAAADFKNQGQFIAALHVSQNLKIPFDQLKAKMTGDSSVSLGAAIKALRPEMSENQATEEAKKAEKAAHEMQIEELEKELRELGSELVAAEGLSFKRTDEAIAESNGKNGLTFAKKGE